MSRSFRKTKNIVLQRKSKFGKIQHNNIVSKAEDVPNGSAHKKFTESWDICDWKWFESSKYLRDTKQEDPRRYYKWISK